jgi:hypothetical protein
LPANHAKKFKKSLKLDESRVQNLLIMTIVSLRMKLNFVNFLNASNSIYPYPVTNIEIYTHCSELLLC